MMGDFTPGPWEPARSKDCQFCGKTHDLFSIELPVDGTDDKEIRKICGNCWNVIAEIVNRVIRFQKHAPEMGLR